MQSVRVFLLTSLGFGVNAKWGLGWVGFSCSFLYRSASVSEIFHSLVDHNILFKSKLATFFFPHIMFVTHTLKGTNSVGWEEPVSDQL